MFKWIGIREATRTVSLFTARDERERLYDHKINPRKDLKDSRVSAHCTFAFRDRTLNLSLLIISLCLPLFRSLSSSFSHFSVFFFVCLCLFLFIYIKLFPFSLLKKKFRCGIRDSSYRVYRMRSFLPYVLATLHQITLFILLLYSLLP